MTSMKNIEMIVLESLRITSNLRIIKIEGESN